MVFSKIDLFVYSISYKQIDYFIWSGDNFLTVLKGRLFIELIFNSISMTKEQLQDKKEFQ